MTNRVGSVNDEGVVVFSLPSGGKTASFTRGDVGSVEGVKTLRRAL